MMVYQWEALFLSLLILLLGFHWVKFNAYKSNVLLSDVPLDYTQKQSK